MQKQTNQKTTAMLQSKRPLTPCPSTELNFWPAGIKPLNYQGRVEAAWFLFICIQQTHSPDKAWSLFLTAFISLPAESHFTADSER